MDITGELEKIGSATAVPRYYKKIG